MHKNMQSYLLCALQPFYFVISYHYHSIPMHQNERNKNKVEFIHISEKTGESYECCHFSSQL